MGVHHTNTDGPMLDAKQARLNKKVFKTGAFYNTDKRLGQHISLKPLQWNGELGIIGQQHSIDMSVRQQVDHLNCREVRFAAIGDAKRKAENVAFEYVDESLGHKCEQIAHKA